MTSRFLDELEALVRSHSGNSAQREAEERLVAAISTVMLQTTREIIHELRGQNNQGARGSAMIRYRPDYDRGQQRQGAMIRYRPDYDRGQQRQGAMIRYRPDYDRDQQRQGAMIRYRPDYDRDLRRQGAMIRYRPDHERDQQRQGAMIRYRPDWDRQMGEAGAESDPLKAAAGMLEPMLKALAERLGPGEAAKLVQSSLSNVGLTAQTAAGDAPQADKS